MKKLSTLVCVLLAGGFANAQNTGVPAKSPAMVNVKKTAVMEKRDVVNGASHSGNRAIIWSDDFDNNPTTVWTRTNTSVPAQDWVFGTALPNSLVTQGFDAVLNSASGGTFAYVDSDGAGGTATQNCNLTTTAAIDMSAAASCQLTFTNYHRRYLETHTIQISTDGGSTWTDFVVNSQYPTSTTSPNGEIVSVNIGCVAAGQSNVLINFNYQGAWDWFWAIDDVVVEDAPADEVNIVSGGFQCDDMNIFGFHNRYTIFPSNEVRPMRHYGVIGNGGANAQTGAKVVAQVTNSTFTVLYTGMGAGQNLGTCASATLNDTTTTVYTSAGTPGTYNNIIAAAYNNIANDADLTNNADTIQHWVNNTLIGQDDNTYRGNGLWNGETGGVSDPYVMGNLIELLSNQTVYAIDVALTGNTDPGVLLCAQIYEVDQTTGDFNIVDETCGGAAEITVNSGHISSGGTITWVHNIFPAPVSLAAGGSYIAAVNHYGGNEALVVMQGGTGADQQTVFLLDGTNATWYYMTSIPMIRFNFDASIGVNEITNGNLELFQNVPNPANGTTSIRFNLLDNADVAFEMVDVTGKVVATADLGNKGIGNHTMTLDVTKFATGIYYYSIIANGNRMTKKMVISE
ncbi:MAG: T9SS type A sorting domain-containing protein [Flavobacteriales bacterium]|nr:T9SS type A sorting domain-containing protein [Flavobacteriales bacterium]